MSSYVLGFDGGGTKSICTIAREDGKVVGVGLSGCTNFQGAGKVAAGQEVKRAIDAAIAQAGIEKEEILTAAFGVSGADRDADFDIVADYIQPHNPVGQMLLANDTTIALRAGTSDGIGIAVICGTGSNCIGFNETDKQAKVGGLGRYTGDTGSGEDIVERAIIAGMKGLDGRGPKTLLAERISKALGIENLVDIIAFFYADNYHPIEIGELVPIVFMCAADGDRVANRLLHQIGKELAHNVTTAARQLFKKNDPIHVVLGGSILQKAKPPILVDEIRNGVLAKYPNAKLTQLRIEPVLGAVFLALDMLHGDAGQKRMAEVKRSYKALAVR